MADRDENRLINEAGVKAPANIKYHAGFVSGLELLLWQYREQVDIEPEKWLSTEGIRMDVLILKKDPPVVLDFDIGRIFRGHNILEYKRPDDKLNIDVFAKVMAYSNLYKSQSIPADSIKYNDISATIYRHAYPRDAFQQLKKHGAEIEEKYPGVYYVTGLSPFPIQILVGRQLDPKEYAMFRVLTPGASDDDIRSFKDIAVRNRDAAYQKSVDNIYQVSVSANKESYARLVKEDPEMCEALRELMREEMQEDFIKIKAEGRAEGKREGKQEGRKEGRKEGIDKACVESIRTVMKKLDYTVSQAMEFLEIPADDRKRYMSMI